MTGFLYKRPYDAEASECATWRELYNLGVKRGYKDPTFWANKKWNGRLVRQARLEREGK